MEDEPPVPKKRSLFSEAVRRKKTHAINDELIFNRAKELEAERLAEEERKRQKRIAKLEKSRSSASVERRDHTETPPKKRKLSCETEDGNDSETASTAEEPEESTGAKRDADVTSPSTRSKTRASYSRSPEPQRSPSQTLSGRYSKSLKKAKTSPSQKKNIISVLDSDSDDISAVPAWKQGSQAISIHDEDDNDIEITFVSKNAAPEPDEEEEEEEEFPELIKKARERERLRLEQAANASKSFSGKNHSQDDYDSFAEEPQPSLDPSVEILITSRIEGSTALKVKRKLSQPLREARFAWCDRQSSGIFTGEDLKSSIFLTWKHKRLFDYTTCVSLGLKLNNMEEVGKVHLEAWTEDTFEAAQKEEEAARRRDELGESEEEEVVAEEVVKYKLVMTAKDMEPVKLVVKNETQFSKLIAAFISQREIPEDKEVTLWLDGDMLDPDDTVADADLEDMDTIEVHVK